MDVDPSRESSMNMEIPAFLEAWNAETSADPSWTPDNPALGQCAVTALFVQDIHGGDLLRCEVPGGSHYWNRLPSGVELDLTAGQFDTAPDRMNVETRTREYLLSNESTSHRYALLVERITRRP